MIPTGKTFDERWKIAAVLMVAGAGIVATIIMCGLIWIVWKGDWSAAVELARVDILGSAAIGMTLLMGASMAGLLIAGPLAKISGKIGSNEVSLEGD